MQTARLVVWAQHGIYGAGKDLDETFGLIETAEKAAEIYMKIAHLPQVNTITDDQMHRLEALILPMARTSQPARSIMRQEDSRVNNALLSSCYDPHM